MLEVKLVRYLIVFCAAMSVFFTIYTMMCISETLEIVERMENRQLFIGQSSYWTPEDSIYHDDDDY